MPPFSPELPGSSSGTFSNLCTLKPFTVAEGEPKTTEEEIGVVFAKYFGDILQMNEHFCYTSCLPRKYCFHLTVRAMEPASPCLDLSSQRASRKLKKIYKYSGLACQEKDLLCIRKLVFFSFPYPHTPHCKTLRKYWRLRTA